MSDFDAASQLRVMFIGVWITPKKSIQVKSVQGRISGILVTAKKAKNMRPVICTDDLSMWSEDNLDLLQV